MKRAIIALSIAAMLLAGCRHTRSGPSNNGSWIGGWTNMVPVNHTGQTFKPISPDINAIDLDIITGNPGRAASDDLTLTIYDGTTVVGTSTVTLPDGADGWKRFSVTPPLRVRPHATYKMELRDTGKVLFGWRYNPDTYSDGVAIMLGVENPAYDFPFRVNPA